MQLAGGPFPDSVWTGQSPVQRRADAILPRYVRRAVDIEWDFDVEGTVRRRDAVR